MTNLKQDTIFGDLQIMTIFLAFIFLSGGCSNHSVEQSIPVIYSTDLYHPPMDPDDNFDLACLFSVKELDIKAIIIDNAARTEVSPGTIPIRQIETIAGRKPPFATGLKHNLKSYNDDGSDQKDSFKGVELILKTLDNSSKPVTIITVGSLRDVAAALNRNIDLCRKKISRIFVFAGDASVTDPAKFREYNVDLDTLAFARVMNSGLNIFWVPCFDGGLFKNNGNASYVAAGREKLLSQVSPRLMNYFTFCLLAKQDSLYIKALDAPVDTQEVNTILFRQEGGSRNLWCSHVFPFIAGRKYVMHNYDSFTTSSVEPVKEDQVFTPFIFTKEDLYSDLSGMVWPDSAGVHRNNINLFRISDREKFNSGMASVVAHLLGELDRQ